jgi:microsomal epoxide hydrolase
VGGDWGGTVTRFLAQMHPDLLVGIHLTDIGFFFRSNGLLDLTPTEMQFLDILEQWSIQEAAYAIIQGTKPQTLAYGLNDSPVGLAGWIVELFRSLSDCNGDVEKSFTKDELLTNIMIYWVTETISSSTRIYYESRHSTVQQQRSEVPTGLAIFPKDIAIPPRSWAERTLRVEHWTQMPRGGHFAAQEEPELLAEDIRAFFRPFRETQRQNQD